jgi:hypothetical protein
VVFRNLLVWFRKFQKHFSNILVNWLILLRQVTCLRLWFNLILNSVAEHLRSSHCVKTSIDAFQFLLFRLTRYVTSTLRFRQKIQLAKLVVLARTSTTTFLLLWWILDLLLGAIMILGKPLLIVKEIVEWLGYAIHLPDPTTVIVQLRHVSVEEVAHICADPHLVPCVVVLD